MKFAVQLYSLRSQIENGDDLFDILAKVRELGFDGVEFAGFYGCGAEALKEKLDSLGLSCVGAHMKLDDMTPEKIDGTLEFTETLGAKAVGIGGADTSTENALLKVLDVMGDAQKRARERNMRVYFHNHTQEFSRPFFASCPDTVFDRIKEVCDMQIDTYWSYFAGQDNFSLITENREHIVHLHIKDGIEGKPKALGEGDNDLFAVVRAAREAGIEWLVLENDDPQPDGLSDIGRSIKWLNANAK